MSKISIWKLSTLANGRSFFNEIQLPGVPGTLDAASRLLPGGVYTTFRTYQRRKILQLFDHIHRLVDSAERLDEPVSLRPEEIRAALRHVLGQAQSDLRLRLSVDLEANQGDVYILAEELKVPSTEQYAAGVPVVTCRLQRDNPLAKQTSFIAEAEAVRAQLPADAYEGLLVDPEGLILEGMSSNFFAVREDLLWTAADGVLHGITRSLVLAAAEDVGIPIRLESIRIDEIASLQEAFLTSSSRCILPVRSIDQKPVGSGRPGRITHRLMRAYEDQLQAHLVEV